MADLSHSTLWYDAMGFQNDVSFAGLSAWTNFSDGATAVNCMPWNGDGACVCEKSVIMSDGYTDTLTLTMYDKIVAANPNTCGADWLVPWNLLDGTPWLSSTGTIMLVRDE